MNWLKCIDKPAYPGAKQSRRTSVTRHHNVPRFIVVTRIKRCPHDYVRNKTDVRQYIRPGPANDIHQSRSPPGRIRRINKDVNRATTDRYWPCKAGRSPADRRTEDGRWACRHSRRFLCDTVYDRVAALDCSKISIISSFRERRRKGERKFHGTRIG